MIPAPDPVLLKPAEPAHGHGHPHHPHRRVSGRTRRWLVAVVLLLLAGGGLAAGATLLNGRLPHDKKAAKGLPQGDPDEEPTAPAPQSVRVVHPKRDPSVRLTVEDPAASVEAYYRADLRARASGLVKGVHKEIGDRVVRGDLLVEIDVPDAVQEVAQKAAVVDQRLQELRVARAMLKNAESGRDVAKASIHEKAALTKQAEATRDFRKTRLARMEKLAKTDTVVAGVIDEEKRDTMAAEAAVDAAKAGEERAKADEAEAVAKIEAATADIDLKASLVEVARKDLEKARAIADYSRILAPFDGVVIKRMVDPGSFVQNATTGSSEPLITVARTDLVTVVARFPDTAAPFIAADTEAEVRIDGVPGGGIPGRVTRFSPSIHHQDRTMRVEVDLFNGTDADYRRIVGRVTAAELVRLTATDPLSSAAARLARRGLLTGLYKGEFDALPAASAATSSGGTPPRLLPGMTGSLKLLLTRFGEGCVLPSTAVYSRNGKPYILTVEDGVTKQHPVRVQLNDGRVAKVALLDRRKDATGATRDVLTELTGHEQVVTSRQMEVGEGAPVTAAEGDW